MAYQPKSYRKFLAASVSAVVAASAIAPVAASAASNNFKDVQAGTELADAVNYLVSTGTTNGESATEFGVHHDITRAQAAKMIAGVMGLDTKNVKDPGFPDVSKDNYYYSYIAAAANAGVFQGDGAGKFNPDKPITRAEAAKVFVKAFGLDLQADATTPFTDVDSNSWAAPYISTLYANGLVKGTNDAGTTYEPNANLQRGAFALLAYRVHQFLQAPQVTSVSAINAKELQVKFNKAIDKDSVIDSADGTLQDGVIKIDNTDATLYYASLSEDGKTLTIQLPSYTADANVKFELVNDGTTYITTTDGTDVPAYVTTFKTSDTTRATLDKVVYVNPDIARVYFSEPIQQPALGTDMHMTYADGTSADGDASLVTPTGSAKNYVDIDVSGLNPGVNTTVLFDGIKDFANNISTPITVTVKKDDSDKVAPTVKLITATSPTSLKIQFSEALKQLGAGAVKVNGLAISGGAGGTGTVEIDENDPTVVNVTLTTPVTTAVPVVVETDAVEDYNANQSVAFSQIVNFAADKTAPTIQSSKVVTISGQNYLQLKMSEDVTLATSSDLVFKYTDIFGVTQTITVPIGNVNVSTTDPTVVNVLLEDGSGVALPSTQPYTVDFATGFFQDAFNNDSVAKTLTVNINGITVPLALKGSTPIVDEDGKGGTLTVDFDHPVDIASATNVSNYSVEGAVVTKAELVSNNLSGAKVRLYLQDGTVENTGFYNVTVSGVKGFYSDVTTMKTVTKNIKINENVRPVPTLSVDGFTGTETDLTLSFSEAVTNDTIDANDYDLYIDGVKDTTATVTVAQATTGTNKLTVTIDKDLSSAIAAGKSVKLVAKDTLDIQDANNNIVTTSDLLVK